MLPYLSHHSPVLKNFNVIKDSYLLSIIYLKKYICTRLYLLYETDMHYLPKCVKKVNLHFEWQYFTFSIYNVNVHIRGQGLQEVKIISKYNKSNILYRKCIKFTNILFRSNLN